jgi:hypothetical protein
MAYAADMCDIVENHAEEKLRFFIRVDPETREQDVLYRRGDLEWTDERAAAVDAELKELVAKDAYEKQMDAGEVTQIIKVADEMVMFTGFIEDEVVVVTVERGILRVLSPVVNDFREHTLANEIELTTREG